MELSMLCWGENLAQLFQRNCVFKFRIWDFKRTTKKQKTKKTKMKVLDVRWFLCQQKGGIKWRILATWRHKPKMDLVRYRRYQRRNLIKTLSSKWCWISVTPKLRRNSSIPTRFFPLYILLWDHQLLHRQGE